MSEQRPAGPETRIGDAEREAAVAALGEHYAAGRLTKEEFDERSDHAYAARTASALWPLFADLPPSGRPVSGPRPPQARAGAAGWSGSPRGERWGGYPPRTRPPWWVGGLLPLLLVVVGLTVLTHLPVFLAVLVGWLLLAKVFRGGASSHRRGPRGPRVR